MEAGRTNERRRASEPHVPLLCALWHSIDRKMRNFFAPQHECYPWDYFMLVKAERRGIDPTAAENLLGKHDFTCFDNELAALETKYGCNRDRLTIQEVWGLDLKLLQLLPMPALRAKALSVWTAYHKLSGERPREPFKEFLNATTGEVKLRADLTDMLRGCYWFQLNAILLERGFRSLKSILLKWAWRGFMITTTAILILHIDVDWGNRPHHRNDELVHALSTVFLTSYLGVLGAVISISRRTKAFNDIAGSDTDPIVRVMAMENGKTSIQLSIVAGGVFALVLYLVFVSGTAGNIFVAKLVPAFQAAPYCLTGMDILLAGFIPATTLDLAKLLMWAFIAGFAEKLVPDVLDRFAKISSRESGSSNPSR